MALCCYGPKILKVHQPALVLFSQLNASSGNSRYCYAGLRKRLRLEPPLTPDIGTEGRKTEQADSEEELANAASFLIREWVEKPVAYRIEYIDGTRATMLLMSGLVGDFTFAARIQGQSAPLSTLFYLPPVPNVMYSAELMAKAEATFMSGKSPCPIERTLLTTGLVEACVQSVSKEQRRMETPHLAIAYAAPEKPPFAQS
jgi:hypothetical protein